MISLIVYDFDGVLTDNRVLVFEDGREAVFCNRSDGWWSGKIRDELKIEQMILSTETNPVVSARARKLKLECVQGQKDKREALVGILKAKGLDPKNVIYVGNDTNDEGCLELVGYPMVPRDANPAVIRPGYHVLPKEGGDGVVLALYEWLIAKGVRR